MSKICKSCGSYYDGDYCDKCGYGKKDLKTKAADKYKKPTVPKKFRTEEQSEIYEKWDKEKKGSTSANAMTRHHDDKAGVKLLIIVAVVVVGVIVAVLIKSGVIFSNKNTDVIDNYFSSIQDSDFDKFVSCFPTEMADEYKQQRTEGNYTKEGVMKDVLYKYFSDTYGSGYTITVKYGKSTKLDKGDYSLDGYKKAYGTTPTISQAYAIITNVTFKGSKGSEKSQFTIYVGKCGTKWKIFNLEEVPGTLTDSQYSADSSSKAS